MEYDESEILERAINCDSFFSLLPAPPLANVSYTLTEVCRIEQLTVADKMRIFDIFAANMHENYVASGWKWDVGTDNMLSLIMYEQCMKQSTV